MFSLRKFLNARATFSRVIYKKMCTKTSSDMVFAQKFNPLSGKVEWETQDENFDYHQEIARSAYGDMLHDTERNQMYEAGLKWAIGKLRSEGKPVRVLDIGTGTGLLSMFACRLGADQVTACEAFLPVARCARKVIKDNGFEDQINLVSKRSTELTVGPGSDLEERATILVTEVFDTELIGEGAISTFNHAHEHLLEKGCLVVPSRAKVYCQVVQSSMLSNCHRHKPIRIPGCEDIVPPPETFSCPGSAAVLDIQMSQLPDNSYTILTKPFQVFSFDFTGKGDKIPSDESSHVTVPIDKPGQCDAILFWWDIAMDEDEKLVLSCAPSWNHPQGLNQQWRDHWMQAVYFPINSCSAKQSESISVSCFHDEYSFWFDIEKRSSLKQLAVVERRPICTCGFHMVCNPRRIYTLNDSHTHNRVVRTLQKVIKSDSVCLLIGSSGCSMLPLIAARLGAKKVYVIDSSRLSVQILNSYLETNNLQSRVVFLSKSCEELRDEDFEEKRIDLVLSEPYFLSSYLPWHDISLWYLVNSLKKTLQSSFKVIPNGCRIWAVGMHFDHLWKTRAPLGCVEGFVMKSFDNFVQNSMSVADPLVEPYSLWEYEGTALTQPLELLDLDITKTIADDVTFESNGVLEFKSPGTCNGVAIWAEWMLESCTSTIQGPRKPIVPGEKVIWNCDSKQGVYFLSPKPIEEANHLTYHLRFIPSSFSYELTFEIDNAHF